MPFWKVGRTTGSRHTDAAAAPAIAPRLEPISVFAAGRSFEGWIVAAEGRVTELLNEHQHLRVCIDAAADRWEDVDRDDILFVAPPEHATDTQLRVHRRKNRLVALVGPYVVTGTVHMRPGNTFDPYLIRRQVQFLPMTDAWVTHRTDPAVELARPVVIVNTANLIELQPAVTEP